MPKVTSFSVNGLELWFNSDDHLPPHFHAEKRGKWEVRVRFMREPEEMIDVVYSESQGRPSRSDLKELRRLAERHRAALLEEWEAKVGVKDPGPDR